MLKSVFTLGPSSNKENTIIELLKNADRFRLNASHLTSEELFLWLNKLDSIFKRVNKTVPVIIDLQGAKMRIGDIEKKEHLPQFVYIYYNNKKIDNTKNIDLFLEKNNISDKKYILENIFEIPTPHKELFEELQKNELLSLNDNRVIIKVLEKSEDSLLCKVIQNGPISSKKGINRVQHPIFYKNITESDKNAIEIGLKFDFTQFAFSFTLTGNEREFFKNIDRYFIAKIESEDSFENLNTIDNNFDEIWLCRGDLGAQVGLNNLGNVCKKFVSKI
ncbi:hypothetical protein JXR93_03320 [bacterium]|nr:hypothetical protein [bacterium]